MSFFLVGGYDYDFRTGFAGSGDIGAIHTEYDYYHGGCNRCGDFPCIGITSNFIQYFTGETAGVLLYHCIYIGKSGFAGV